MAPKPLWSLDICKKRQRISQMLCNMSKESDRKIKSKRLKIKARGTSLFI